jgi:folate-binding protein YgfZ
MAFFTPLPHRALITVCGEDRHSFLQGLVSNDLRKVEQGEVIWAALLTPQGKFLHEFFIFSIENVIFMECERDRREDLLSRLSRYKLRSKVELAITESLMPGAAWGEQAIEALALTDDPNGLLERDKGVIYRDPRLMEAGARWAFPPEMGSTILEACGLTLSTPEDYDQHRLTHGLPDGSRDMEIEKALLLESGFEELHGVDFQKGCYMGQELTARTHYRALIKKRLMPVTIDGPITPSTSILKVDGADAAKCRPRHARARKHQT